MGTDDRRIWSKEADSAGEFWWAGGELPSPGYFWGWQEWQERRWGFRILALGCLLLVTGRDLTDMT